jgi:DNA ligase (NAD+)
VETELVKSVADLYSITIDDLRSIDRMGQKSAEKCYRSLWDKNPIPLDQFIGGLSIPLIGTATVKLLINAGMISLDKIMSASINSFSAIKGLGPSKAKSLFNGLIANKEVINLLLERGVKVGEIKSGGGKLSGINICITGSTNIKRADLSKMIEDAGGGYRSSITSDCNCLVSATDSSTKARKAAEKGIKVITEQALLEMINA